MLHFGIKKSLDDTKNIENSQRHKSYIETDTLTARGKNAGKWAEILYTRSAAEKWVLMWIATHLDKMHLNGDDDGFNILFSFS